MANEKATQTVTQAKLECGADTIDGYMVLLAEVAVTTETQAVSAFLGCPPSNEVVGRYHAVLEEETTWFAEQVKAFAERSDRLMRQHGELTLSKLKAQAVCQVEGCQDKEPARIILEEVLGGDSE